MSFMRSSFMRSPVNFSHSTFSQKGAAKIIGIEVDALQRELETYKKTGTDPYDNFGWIKGRVVEELYKKYKAVEAKS